MDPKFSASKESSLFQSGPRYKEDGTLIKYSIVGNPDKFIKKQIKQNINNSGEVTAKNIWDLKKNKNSF